MHHLKNALDTASGLAVFLGIINALPATMTIISTGLASIWYGIQIYRALRGKRKTKELE